MSPGNKHTNLEKIDPSHHDLGFAHLTPRHTDQAWAEAKDRAKTVIPQESSRLCVAQISARGLMIQAFFYRNA